MNERFSNFLRSLISGCLSLAVFGCFPDWDFGREGPAPLEKTDAGNDDRPTEIVTIAAYNVEDFDLGQEAEGQYDHIAAFVKDNLVDIFAVEEAEKDANGDDEALFSAALKNVSYEMPYREFSSMSDGFNAQAVWSRFPLSDAEEILAENTRTVLRFTATVGDEAVVFLLCHLKSGDDTESLEKRTSEALRIRSYVMDNYDPTLENIVILGDLNTMTDADFDSSGTLGNLSSQSNATFKADDFTPVNYTELPHTPTYPSTGSILDHVLLSPAAGTHYVPRSVEVPTPDGDGPYGPSDHYPVMLDLSM